MCNYSLEVLYNGRSHATKAYGALAPPTQSHLGILNENFLFGMTITFKYLCRRLFSFLRILETQRVHQNALRLLSLRCLLT
jgi:hypothetical protein